jgi:hypothetical protein
MLLCCFTDGQTRAPLFLAPWSRPPPPSGPPYRGKVVDALMHYKLPLMQK